MHRGLGGSWLISWPRSWLRINRWPGHFHIGAVVTTLDAGRPVWTPAATSRPTIFTCKLDIICQLGWVNPCSDDSNHLERKQGQRYGRTYVLYQRNVHWFVNRLSSSAAWLCAESVLSLGVCENRDGRLVAWGLCGSMLIRFSTVWLLPFTLL